MFFAADDKVGHGLPLLPELYDHGSHVIARPGIYACTNCGNVQRLEHAEHCGLCNGELWVAAIADKRIA